MKSPRVSKAIGTVVVLVLAFIGAVAVIAVLLIGDNRRTALTESEAQAKRFVSGAEAAINRTILGIDVLLASMDTLMNLSNLRTEWIDAEASGRILQNSMRQNMLVRLVALIDTNEKVVASSDPSGASLVLRLPEGFIKSVLEQQISGMAISAPLVSFGSSDRVLYFARHIKLADGSKLVALAEVQVSQLTSILVQGVDIEGLETTLERANGQMFASMPLQESLSGTFLSPALGDKVQQASAFRMGARLSGRPAIVAVRMLLYRDILITASIPEESSLQEWQKDSIWITAVALVFAAMILVAGVLAIRYLERIAAAHVSVARSKETLDQALASMQNGFLLLNNDFQVVTWNRRYLEIFPWLTEVVRPSIYFREVLEFAAINNRDFSSPELRDQWINSRMELLTSPNGSHEQTLPDGRTIEITERSTPDGGVVIVYQDVTQLRQASAEIEQLAFYDPLTGLPNRRLLTDRLQQALLGSARYGRRGSLLFMDLDHFKTLNDTLGHDMGDQLLVQVAQRLRSCVRVMDTVARLGGDEFVVMLQDLGPSTQEALEQTRKVGDTILSSLTQPYQLQGTVHRSSCSMGAALYGDVQQSPADLLKQADIAMYQVKASGRNGLCFFDQEMLTTITAKADLERDLRVALAKDQFVLHYQLQVFQGPHALQAVGAEVLVRWKHPVKGMVSPLQFISIAEETGLIVPIGLWVLQTACRQLRKWVADPLMADLLLAVNVSARQFRQDDFVAQVTSVLATTGANPNRLKLELTESLVLDDVQDSIEKMNAIKALGVRFSMDDFGTGQSSLSYLTQLPLSQLKIDQSFVRNIGMQASDSVIIDTIIGMASNLGLEVIAEGVETPEQRAFLLKHGCHMYQGYLFGKPMPLAQFEELQKQTAVIALP